MANDYTKPEKRKTKTSYLSTVISISLVLFILGLLGVILLDAKKISNYSKENLRLLIIFNEDVNENDIITFQSKISKSAFVKKSEFISKERAAEDLRKQIGEDFLSFLGENPLPYSINVYPNSEYANQDSLAKFEKSLLSNEIIKEINYEKSLIAIMNDNIQKISIFLIGFSFLLLIISITLINNTIRLSIYSGRFIIKSMQLVGATKGFIRKPLLIRGLIQGLIGGIIALGLLAGLLYLAQLYIPELNELQSINMYLMLSGIVLILGILITGISTYFAVRKYLKIKTDNLYYY